MQLWWLQQPRSQVTCSSDVLQVVNWTELELRVGLRTAVSREINLVGSLPPGQQCWLPAVRAESSMLHVQPAGAQSGGGLLTGICWAVYCIQTGRRVSACLSSRMLSLQASDAGVLEQGDEAEQGVSAVCLAGLKYAMQWSPGIRLQPLLDLAAAAATAAKSHSRRVARHVPCKEQGGGSKHQRFHLGVVMHPSSAGQC